MIEQYPTITAITKRVLIVWGPAHQHYTSTNQHILGGTNPDKLNKPRKCAISGKVNKSRNISRKSNIFGGNVSPGPAGLPSTHIELAPGAHWAGPRGTIRHLVVRIRCVRVPETLQYLRVWFVWMVSHGVTKTVSILLRYASWWGPRPRRARRGG